MHIASSCKDGVDALCGAVRYYRQDNMVQKENWNLLESVADPIRLPIVSCSQKLHIVQIGLQIVHIGLRYWLWSHSVERG